MRVPTERHSRARLITSTTKETGRQSQLFSPRQSMEKASMTLQPGDMNLELNLGAWALSETQNGQWDADPICNPTGRKPPDSRTSHPYRRNDWEDWLWDWLREEFTENRSEPSIHWAIHWASIVIVAGINKLKSSFFVLLSHCFSLY